MSFHVGQLVETICDDEWVLDGDDCTPVAGPRRGEIVTVRASGVNAIGVPGIWLVEYPGTTMADLFDIESDGEPNFRPLSDSRLAIFRKLLAPSPIDHTEDA